MRFGVVGADKDSGNDVEVIVTAKSREEAEQEACRRGILVSGIKPIAEDTADAIALVDDDEDTSPGGTAINLGSAVGHASTGARPGSRTSHGTITVNASNPSDTAHTGDGSKPIASLVDPTACKLEYHILMNQSLYLLEAAVNKQLRDGWEPQGGLGIGMSNNAQVFYQSMVRRKR